MLLLFFCCCCCFIPFLSTEPMVSLCLWRPNSKPRFPEFFLVPLPVAVSFGRQQRLSQAFLLYLFSVIMSALIMLNRWNRPFVTGDNFGLDIYMSVNVFLSLLLLFQCRSGEHQRVQFQPMSERGHLHRHGQRVHLQLSRLLHRVQLSEP